MKAAIIHYAASLLQEDDDPGIHTPEAGAKR